MPQHPRRGERGRHAPLRPRPPWAAIMLIGPQESSLSTTSSVRHAPFKRRTPIGPQGGRPTRDHPAHLLNPSSAEIQRRSLPFHLTLSKAWASHFSPPPYLFRRCLIGRPRAFMDKFDNLQSRPALSTPNPKYPHSHSSLPSLQTRASETRGLLKSRKLPSCQNR